MEPEEENLASMSMDAEGEDEISHDIEENSYDVDNDDTSDERPSSPSSMSLTELLEISISAEDVGTVNFNILRLLLSNMIQRLETVDNTPVMLAEDDATNIAKHLSFVQGESTEPVQGVLRVSTADGSPRPDGENAGEATQQDETTSANISIKTNENTLSKREKKKSRKKGKKGVAAGTDRNATTAVQATDDGKDGSKEQTQSQEREDIQNLYNNLTKVITECADPNSQFLCASHLIQIVKNRKQLLNAVQVVETPCPMIMQTNETTLPPQENTEETKDKGVGGITEAENITEGGTTLETDPTISVDNTKPSGPESQTPALPEQAVDNKQEEPAAESTLKPRSRSPSPAPLPLDPEQEQSTLTTEDTKVKEEINSEEMEKNLLKARKASKKNSKQGRESAAAETSLWVASRNAADGTEEEVEDDQMRDDKDREKEDIQMLYNNLANVIAECAEQKDKIDQLLDAIRIMESGMVTKQFLMDMISDKADRGQINTKVSYDEFGNTVDELHAQLHNLMIEGYQRNENWKKITSDLAEELAEKLDKVELAPIRAFFKSRLKKLEERVTSLAAILDEPDPAGTRKKLLKDYNCLSCDRKVNISGVTNCSPMSLPKLPPGAASSASRRTYDLHKLRNQRNCFDGEAAALEKRIREQNGQGVCYSGNDRQTNDKDMMQIVNRYVGSTNANAQQITTILPPLTVAPPTQPGSETSKVSVAQDQTEAAQQQRQSQLEVQEARISQQSQQQYLSAQQFVSHYGMDE